ncbi:MAG: diguanylate cyclase [Nitrospiraceae bacterium]|nr:MAG: diguanylate cyclase [Nitrospiraceae bacterium]
MTDNARDTFRSVHIALIALGIGVLFWFLETAIEYFFLHPGVHFYELLIPRTRHELWMRTLIVLLTVTMAYLIVALSRHLEIERALKRSELTFRSLFDQASDSIFLLTPSQGDLIIKDANKAALTTHGYTRDELIGKSITMLDDPDTIGQFPDRVKSLLSGAPLNAEARHVRKDGSTFPVEVSARSIEIEGRPFIIAFDRDITNRKIAEDALLYSRKALITVLDGIESVIYASDMKTYELLYMNRYTKALFGEAEGKLCWQVLQKGQSGPCDFCTNDKLLTREGQPAGIYHWQFQNTVNRKWYDIQDRAIQWVDGRLARLEIATDITVQKEVESELIERMKLAELTAAIGSSMTEGATLSTMLEGCTISLVTHLDAFFARIWIYDEENDSLVLRASSGRYTRLDGYHSRKKPGVSKIGMIAQEKSPIVTKNIIGDPQIIDQEWAKQEGVLSFAGHPLMVENRLIGVMALFSRNVLPELTLRALMSVARIISVGIDQKLAEEKVTAAKEEWERTFDIIPDLIAIIDTNYRIARANRALTEKLAMTRNDIIGKKCFTLLHGTEAPPDYCPHLKCVTGAEECVNEVYEEKLGGYYIMSASPIFDKSGNITGSVHVARDISARKIMESRLEEAAITDELTGLFNRRGFLTLAEQQCRLADRIGQKISLLYLDLDGFKNINDELGHEIGDQALTDMAAVLRKTFRASDIVSRIGGDEFAVLLTERTESGIEETVTGHLQKNLNDHNQHAGRPYELLVSAGIAHYNGDRKCSTYDLMREADARMYRHKKYHHLTRQVTPFLKGDLTPRRIYARFSTGEDCWAELDISGKARIKNISLGGACLKTFRPLAKGSTCSIRISPTEFEDITLTGVVIWSSVPAVEDRKEDLPFEAGLKFIELSDSIKSSLEKLIGYVKD